MFCELHLKHRRTDYVLKLRGLTPYSRHQAVTPIPSLLIQAQTLPPPHPVPSTVYPFKPWSLSYTDVVPAALYRYRNRLRQRISSLHYCYWMASQQEWRLHCSNRFQDRTLCEAQMRIWPIEVPWSESGEGSTMDLSSIYISPGENDDLSFAYLHDNTTQKTVSDLALKVENRIPAVPFSQQERSTVKRIIDSVSLCPYQSEPHTYLRTGH
jgi:hypothetical protein